jgi:hypothetical protein
MEELNEGFDCNSIEVVFTLATGTIYQALPSALSLVGGRYAT